MRAGDGRVLGRGERFALPVRYLVALAAVLFSTVLREALIAAFGPLPPYITFYPAVMAVALRCGLGPGLLATALSALVTAYRILPPEMTWRIERASDLVGLGLFGGMGVFMTAVATLYRQERSRTTALALDRAVQQTQERALQREAEVLRRYELLAANTRDIVLFMRREDGRILEANAAALAAYGYPQDELLSLTVHALRAPGTQPWTVNQMAEADASGVLFETVHRRKDGSTFPVEVSSQGSTLHGERTLISIVRDITARKQAEALIQGEQEQFRWLAEAVPQLVWTADRDGRFIYMNTRWREYTGQRPGEESWLDAIHPEDRELSVAAWSTAIADTDVFEVEHRLRRADGDYRWFLRRAYRLSDAGGRGWSWFGTCTDIDDLKTSQDVLRRADRLKEDFLAMASHEFRTPLGALRMQTELLRRRLRGADVRDDRIERQLHLMDAQVSKIDKLLGVLLDVSRINAGRFTLDLAEVDLAEVAREVVDRLSPEAEAAETALRIDAESARGTWDRTRLDQVLTNLVGNAIKYGNQQPVSVRVRALDGAGQVAVRDSGIGIPPEQQLRLFERFERAENARAFSGLGLGLWIARRIVEAHGGQITVESLAGLGSTFTVSLPASPPA
jgi:PAS domain S-box-containing protein